MTREQFDAQLQRMVPLKAMPGDTDGYWEALQDIPNDVLEAAIGHALKTRAWFPTPAELRLDADAVRRREPLPAMPRPTVVDLEGVAYVEVRNPLGGPALRLAVTREWRRDCHACDDTGWAAFWCGPDLTDRYPWLRLRRCERADEHHPHEWVVVCGCIPTNPTIQRRKAAGLRYAQEPETVRG